MPKAAQARNPALQYIRRPRSGKRFLQQAPHFRGRLRGVWRISLHLGPEVYRVAQLAQRHHAQPLVMLRQNKRAASRIQRVPIALFDGFRGFALG